MELTNFTSDKANTPVEVYLFHPVTGVKTDVSFNIVSLDSTAAQACLDKQQTARYERLSKDGAVVVEPFSPAENRAQTIELLVACTVGWNNLVWEGSDLTFSPDNAKMVYEKVPAIRDLLNKATGQRALFYKG